MFNFDNDKDIVLPELDEVVLPELDEKPVKKRYKVCPACSGTGVYGGIRGCFRCKDDHRDAKGLGYITEERAAKNAAYDGRVKQGIQRTNFTGYEKKYGANTIYGI